MNKLSKAFVKTCFCIWLANSILPQALVQYKAFALLAGVGKYVNYAVYISAFIAFIIPMLPQKKQQEEYKSSKSTFILHDLDPESAYELFGDIPDAKFYCVSKKLAGCKGFYDCWLKTPGICALHDGTESIGKEIALCDEFIIVSKSLYGGFGMEIKNALDRSISFALPFFQVRNKEQHHQPRYLNSGKMRVYIYNIGEISESDKTSLSEIAKANSINLNKLEPAMYFIQDLKEISI